LTTKTKAKEKAPPVEEEPKPQVSPHAEDAYRHLGYERLPAGLLKIHNSYKKARNTLSPTSKISVDGFAAINAIYEAG